MRFLRKIQESSFVKKIWKCGSDKLAKYEKEYFARIMEGTATEVDLPKKGSLMSVMIVELKWNRTADSAIFEEGQTEKRLHTK